MQRLMLIKAGIQPDIRKISGTIINLLKNNNMKKAEATRLYILQKSFELIYTKGYQATSIDEIIATTKVTKGAFYYHFKNKDEMGAAIINEVLKPTMLHNFIEPLQSEQDPVKVIYKMMKYLLLENEALKVAYGCPAGNLAQEMAPWNTVFTEALADLTNQWKQALELCISNGKKVGLVRKDIAASQVAVMVMSGYWGVRNMGKLYDDTTCYHAYLKELKQYLQGLK